MPELNSAPNKVAPIIGWPGGKTRLLSHILPLIVGCPHKTYVEPFAGGAAVLLAKPPSRKEVLNDLNGELVNLYRCARAHTHELLRLVRSMPSGRAIFREIYKSTPDTDLLKAARTLYLLKCSVLGQGHSWCNNPPPRGLGRKMAAFAVRLRRVLLECRPAEEILPIYDAPDTLFYLDPPYVGTRRLDAYANYTPEAFAALATQVKQLKGKWVLSIDDRPEHRALFEGYTIIPIQTIATMRLNGSKFGELIIHNLSEARE